MLLKKDCVLVFSFMYLVSVDLMDRSYGTFDFITQANLPFRNGANLTFNVPSYPNQIFVEGELIIT